MKMCQTEGLITPQDRQNRIAQEFIITFRVPHNLKTKITYFWRYFQITGGPSDSALSERQRRGGRGWLFPISPSWLFHALSSGRSHQRTAVRCGPTYSEVPLATGRCLSQWSSKVEQEAWVAMDTGSRIEHLPSPWRNEEQSSVKGRKFRFCFARILGEIGGGAVSCQMVHSCFEIQAILLPQPPESWNHRSASPCPTQMVCS